MELAGVFKILRVGEFLTACIARACANNIRLQTNHIRFFNQPDGICGKMVGRTVETRTANTSSPSLSKSCGEASEANTFRLEIFGTEIKE
jgi:hypothetical protein